MTIYETLCLFGIPTLLLGFLKWVINQIKGVKLGVKALLRAQIIGDYNRFMEQGYAPINAKDNFHNCWEQYHAIKGPNGVIDDIHDKLLALPTQPFNSNKEET